jgi:hypothetical protein
MGIRPFVDHNPTHLLQYKIWVSTVDGSKLSEKTIEGLKTDLVWLLKTSNEILNEKILLTEIEQGHPFKQKIKSSDERVEQMTNKLNKKEKMMKQTRQIYATKVFNLLQIYERKVAVLKHHKWQKKTGTINDQRQKAEEGEEGRRVVPTLSREFYITTPRKITNQSSKIFFKLIFDQFGKTYLSNKGKTSTISAK